MIVRIVKMKFKKEKINDFIKFSKEIKPIIKEQTGCLFLDILQDVKDKEIFFTCSHWNNEDDLNNYKETDFFKNVWPKAKEWFAGKPEAWSLINTEKENTNE